jgi:hypothetical protein
MKKEKLLLIFCLVGYSLFAQDINSVAPGAEKQLAYLINKPSLVKPAVATSMEKSWFRLETDAHVITDKVSIKQVAAVLQDIENHGRYFNGEKSKLKTNVVSKVGDELIVDFVSIAIVPVVKISLETPYRGAVKVLQNTNTKFFVDIKQIPLDSANNKKIRNLYAPRYVEEITIDDKKYTYIRMYTIEEVDVSILKLGAKGTLEKNAEPVNVEALNMLIEAAKSK